MAAAKSGTGSGQKDEPIIPVASTVKPKDDKVIEIAQFAVVTYNKQAGTDLVFINVEFGFWWSISGATYYMLAIKAQDDKGTYCDVALVADILESGGHHTYKLIWYNHKKNVWGLQKDQPIIPPATTVNPEDPHVIEIAQFAVVTYNKQAGTDLVFIKVEFGFRWGNLGATDYMLAIKTQDDKGTYCDVALVADIVVSGGHTYDLIWYNHNNN
ncbi:uncharacterized protein [Coffea arabica]|uniref:Cystatin domain-containing protein n=1 Tax=Coffea arabica TaxID=13443 RepID=A0ABM4X6Y0_COFAR